MAFIRKIFTFALFFCSLFCGILCVEEVVITHAPEAVKFLSSEPIRSSYLGDIFSSLFGYTIRSNIEWHSLSEVPPWKRPVALVVLEILGFDSKVDLPLNGNKFLLENFGDLNGQYDLIAHRTNERYFGKNPVMLHMDMSDELHDSKISQPILLKSLPADPQKRLQMAIDDPELGQLVKDSTFNISRETDVKLLTELATVKEFLKALSYRKSEIRDSIPDIYWMKISGMSPILSSYGPNSVQAQEAFRLVRQIIADVERYMRDIYDDNVVISIIKTNDTPLDLGHMGRRLLADNEEILPLQANEYNLASMYDPMFPVIFIIFVFIGIFLILAVLGTSIALWNMDPGRDSIIYRMTSQRMKKD